MGLHPSEPHGHGPEWSSLLLSSLWAWLGEVSGRDILLIGHGKDAVGSALEDLGASVTYICDNLSDATSLRGAVRHERVYVAELREVPDFLDGSRFDVVVLLDVPWRVDESRQAILYIANLGEISILEGEVADPELPWGDQVGPVRSRVIQDENELLLGDRHVEDSLAAAGLVFLRVDDLAASTCHVSGSLIGTETSSSRVIRRVWIASKSRSGRRVLTDLLSASERSL